MLRKRHYFDGQTYRITSFSRGESLDQLFSSCWDLMLTLQKYSSTEKFRKVRGTAYWTCFTLRGLWHIHPVTAEMNQSVNLKIPWLKIPLIGSYRFNGGIIIEIITSLSVKLYEPNHYLAWTPFGETIEQEVFMKIVLQSTGRQRVPSTLNSSAQTDSMAQGSLGLGSLFFWPKITGSLSCWTSQLLWESAWRAKNFDRAALTN